MSQPGRNAGHAYGTGRDAGYLDGTGRGPGHPDGTGRVPGHQVGGGPHRRDAGAASLWVLAVGLVLVAAGVAGSAVGAARVARHQARVAADLGALAGAARTLDGPEAACDRAGQLVRANGARLTGCVLDGLDLQLTAEVVVEPLPGLTRTATAVARAGPVRG